MCGLPAFPSGYGFDFAHRRPGPLFTLVSGLPWLFGHKTIRNRSAMRREVWRGCMSKFLFGDRCATSCYAESTPTPRAGLITGIGKVVFPARVMAVAATTRRTHLRSCVRCLPFPVRPLKAKGEQGTSMLAESFADGEAPGIRIVIGDICRCQ
jgi:hypothetical protein